MSFANPLGLFALLAIPAIVALHLFRRRLRQREVAGLFLWQTTAPRADAGRRRTRLLRSSSLWLELAAAVLLALWLAGPRLGSGAQVVHVVVVVDDSASMGARGGDGERPAAEIAKRRVRELVEALPNDGVATVIRSGPRPEVLCGPRAPGLEATRSLAGWRPSATGHDLLPALELAAEIGGASGRLVLLTDSDLRDVPGGFRVEAMGAAVPNAALLACRRIRIEDGRESVLCDVAAFGRPLAGAVEVVGGDGLVLGRSDASFGLGRSTHVAVDFDAVDVPVTVRVAAPDDGLSVDDECALPVPPARIVHISAALDTHTAARLDLARVARALSGVTVVDDPLASHVRFVAAPGPLEPGRHEVVIGPVGDQRDAWVGPFLVDRRSPLCEGVTFDGVVWTAGRGGVPGDSLALADAQVLASAEIVGGDALRLRLNLDPMRSNLTSSPDWPILLANVVEYARARLPGIAESVVPVGGVIRFRGDTLGVELVAADGSRSAARGRGLASWEARVPGLLRIERERRVVDVVSVQFVDPRESDLTHRSSFVRVVERAAPAVEQRIARGDVPGRTEARVLALLLLAILVLDWWVLRSDRGGRGG